MDCSEQTAALFDFDGTLIDGDSVLYWLAFYYGRRPMRRFLLFLNVIGAAMTVLGVLPISYFKRLLFIPMCYESEQDLDLLATDFIRYELPGSFCVDMLERMWAHHRLGHKLIVISASAEFYLKHLSSVFPPCIIIGTELIFPKTGLVRVPRYALGNIRGMLKLDALRLRGCLPDCGSNCFAYSDHHSDAPLLGVSNFPCCVRPTAALLRTALEHGWIVLPVSLQTGNARANVEKALLLLFGWRPAKWRRSPSAMLSRLIRGGVDSPGIEWQMRDIEQVLRSMGGGSCEVKGA